MPCASSRRPTAQRFVGRRVVRRPHRRARSSPTSSSATPRAGAFPDQPAPDHDPLSHLELVRNADAFLIAPASANTIAKLAHGLADNLLTSAALAATCPVLVAPAMNNHMYEHAATQANLALLRERGVIVVDPGTGALGSKHEWGIGRLAEPAELLAAVEAVVPAGGRPWDGLKVLVTAGGTREPIDSVRFVGNRSSGRMGFALAEEAAALGAEVTVIAANVGLARTPRVRYVDVVTAAELQERVRGALRRRRRAAHGRRGGRLPARPRAADTKLKKDAREELDRRARTYSGHPVRPRRHPPRRSDRRRLRRRARRRARWPTGATSSRARASTPSWSTTSRARTSASKGQTTRSRSSPPPASAMSRARPKAEIARAILEAVAGLRSGERTTA